MYMYIYISIHIYIHAHIYIYTYIFVCITPYRICNKRDNIVIYPTDEAPYIWDSIMSTCRLVRPNQHHYSGAPVVSGCPPGVSRLW